MFPTQTAALMNPSNAQFIHDYRSQLQQGPNANAAGAPKEIKSFIQETGKLGQEVHTKKPGTAPYPKGKVPVFFVGVDANPRGPKKITSLSHGYVVAAHNPAQGKKTHPTYFSRSSDEKRGRLTIDKKFVEEAGKKVNKDGTPTFSKEALAALGNVDLKKYPSKEAFFLAYAEQRQKQGGEATLKNVVDEYIQLTFMGTENDMEVWVREPNGPDAAKPNLAERDVRTFMNPFSGESASTAKQLFNRVTREEMTSGNVVQAGSMAIRCIPKADVLRMNEARSQELLERLFGDEVQNRNGTLVPASMFGRPEITLDTPLKDVPLAEMHTFSEESPQNVAGAKSDYAKSQGNSAGERVQISNADKLEERIANFAANKQVYEFAPEEGKEIGINCNTGAKSILTDSGLAESDIEAATPFQVAIHNEAHSWNPLSRNPDPFDHLPEQQVTENNPRHDTTSIRGEAMEGNKRTVGTLLQSHSVVRQAEKRLNELKTSIQYDPSTRTEADVAEVQAAVARLMADPRPETLTAIMEERQWEGSSDSDHHQ